jgi:hypothetical protein
MNYKAKVAVCSEIRTKHSTQSEHHVEFLNVKTWWYVRKPLGLKKFNTASGIVTVSEWPSGAQVEKKFFFLNLCTGRSLTESDDTRCCINTIWRPEDEQDIARNMYM